MLNRAPNIYTFESLRQVTDGSTQAEIEPGKWAPARPLGFYSIGSRLNAAWMVFTGKADALIWPGGQ